METTRSQRYRGIRSCTSVILWLLFSSCAFAQTVWDGMYTADQARRGQTAYLQYCVTCHKPHLLGIEAALKSEPFIERRPEEHPGTLFLDLKNNNPRP